MNEKEDFILPFMISDHSTNGRIVSLDSTIEQIISLHNYPDKISEILAELLVISCFLGQNLKKEGIVTCQIQNGTGAINLMVAEYTFGGGIRGYAGFEENKISNNSSFHDLVKKEQLVVTVESGDEKYQGIINLDKENLAKSFELYLEKSEQIDASLVLSVGYKYIFDEKKIYAKGIILKKMPKYDEPNSDKWLKYKHFIHSVSKKELSDIQETELLKRLFHADGVLLFDMSHVYVKCRCSREKMKNILKTIPKEEKISLSDDGKIIMKCQFCSKEEIFYEK